MRLVWSSGVPDQESFRQQWNALVFQMEQPQVFYTWEWAAAVARAYSTSLEPCVVAAYEGEDLVGVAALAKTSNTKAVFLAGTTADYCDFVSLPALRSQFVIEVLGALRERGVRRVVLANLPADSASVPVIQENGLFRTFVRTGYECARVVLGSDEERAALRKSVVHKQVVRRGLSALQRLGTPSLAQYTEPTEALESFITMHVARFLCVGQISNIITPERRKFLAELMQLLAPQKWFVLTALRAGDRDVAYNLGFRFHGSWLLYQPAFANELQDLSLGICLIAKTIEQACDDNDVCIVDLGLGAEGYKERFANGQRTTLHVTLSRSRLQHMSAKGRYQVAERIKLSPRLELLARRMQRRITGRRLPLPREGSNPAPEPGRMRRWISGEKKVMLFRWTGTSFIEKHLVLVPMNWTMLAQAAMRYWNDPDTLDYLMRAARRFDGGRFTGYGLVGVDGGAQYFAWTAPREGSVVAEAGQAPSPSQLTGVMIFDDWMPQDLEKTESGTSAIRDLASQLAAQGKDVWTFRAVNDAAGITLLEEAGFKKESVLNRSRVPYF